MSTRTLLLCLSALLMTACSGTISTVDGKDGGPALVYSLEERVADRILFNAMKSEVPESDIERVSSPYPGYSGKVTWGMDVDHVILSMRPASGRKDDGTLVEGYVFEASHKGTAPASGVPTARRLFDRVVKDAGELADTGKFVSYRVPSY